MRILSFKFLFSQNSERKCIKLSDPTINPVYWGPKSLFSRCPSGNLYLCHIIRYTKEHQAKLRDYSKYYTELNCCLNSNGKD